MQRRVRAAITLTLALAAVSACASAAENGEPDSTRVFVEVENNARSDLDISLVRGGQEIRLGRVQIGDTRRFRAPSAFLRTTPYIFGVRLVARDGSGSYTTPDLTVQEGQNVFIDASPTLPGSSFRVR